MTRVLRVMLAAAGSRAPQLRSTLRYSVVASVTQAAAYAAFLPLLVELTREPARAVAVWTWVAVIAGLVVAEGVLRVAESRFTYDHWHEVTEETRLRLGEKLREIPQQELGRRAAGDLATVVGANAANAASGASSLATLFVQFVTVPVVLLVVVLVVDPWVGLVVLVGCLATLPLLRTVQRTSLRGFGEVDRADAASAARLVEYVQGLPVFRATGQAGAGSPRLAAALQDQHREMDAVSTDSDRAAAGMQLVVELTVAAVVAVGAVLVLAGDLTLALFTGIVVIVARFVQPLGLLPEIAKLFENSDASMRRIRDLDAVEPLPVAAGGRVPDRFDITFERVSFTYEGATEPALREVSLVVPERSITALVGPSGSGKSTVTRLITRFADPQHGTVAIGGVDLHTLDPRDVVAHVAVVFQDVYLFDDTVRANIAMSRPDASDDEIERAARAANAHDFISALPQGYDTGVGEIGGRLSGGERQRLSIARAFLKDAPVVLLDEPTAALDVESEVAVQRALTRLAGGRTVLMIAHRLSTIAGADQVLVVDDGQIAQRGTHAELITERGGRYARLWAAQTGGWAAAKEGDRA